MESIIKQLYGSFINYIEYATPYLQAGFPWLPTEMADKKIVPLQPLSSSWLKATTEKIEESKEFDSLSLNLSFALEGKVKNISERGQFDWERNALRNYFRRSKLYLRISKKEPIKIDGYFEKLLTALNEREIRIISLQLIDGVHFLENKIDFDTFIIQRFSEEEFQELVDNEVNNIFFPNAKLDFGKLCHYWFIREEKKEKTQKEDLFTNELAFSKVDNFRVSRTFPNRIIQLLALFDWENQPGLITSDIKSDWGWMGFQIPISLQITDDYFHSPSPSPNITSLELFPIYDEVEETPLFYNWLVNDHIDRLREIVCRAERFFKGIDLSISNWEFLNIAMGYLGKAFLTEGLEQLLWHMTTIEALLGEKIELMASLKRRISMILGKTDYERKEIRKKIDELYDFRSDLVHGNKFEKEVYQGHLREARKIARNSLLWVLTYLSNIHETFCKNSIPQNEYPKREEIWNLLEFEKEALGRIGKLITDLPIDFPNIQMWGK